LQLGGSYSQVVRIGCVLALADRGAFCIGRGNISLQNIQINLHHVDRFPSYRLGLGHIPGNLVAPQLATHRLGFQKTKSKYRHIEETPDLQPVQ
jgi:hypothetical protein